MNDKAMVYYEFFDDEDGEWHLGRMPACQAFISQLVLGDKFRYVDESKIEIVEDWE